METENYFIIAFLLVFLLPLVLLGFTDPFLLILGLRLFLHSYLILSSIYITACILWRKKHKSHLGIPIRCPIAIKPKTLFHDDYSSLSYHLSTLFQTLINHLVQ